MKNNSVKSSLTKIQPYTKIITNNDYAVCAIYERHPFRDSAIQKAVQSTGAHTNQHTQVQDDEWCWVYYDWCGNPVGLSDTQPDGELVSEFTAENLGDENLAKYLNIIPGQGS